MKAFYHDIFTIPLPEGHRFPADKYVLLRQRILEENRLSIYELILSGPASDDQLRMAHSQQYVDNVKQGRLSQAELRRLGFPWSPQLVERSYHSVGSTIAACRAAMEEGTAVNLGGGTHHAHASHGEGFCVFNDVAVAARLMQAEGRAQRILMLDCDVHQGDGTAAIFQDDPSVFTFSIHAEKNFPFRKEASDLDIGLADGCSDAEYLEALQRGLECSFQAIAANLVIYLAGADPFKDDRLGRLALTMQGLAERDRMVARYCLSAGLPVAIVMAGGYGKIIQDTVSIHLNTIGIFRR
jgi:acetoin utilization deacetylase AcuC-like enzyme